MNCFVNILYMAFSIWLANSQLGYMDFWISNLASARITCPGIFQERLRTTTKASVTGAGYWVNIWTSDFPNSNLYFLIYNTLLWGCVCMVACVSVGVWVTPMCHFNSLWAMPQLVFSVFHACWVYIITLEHHLCLISQSALFGCHWNQLAVWVT